MNLAPLVPAEPDESVSARVAAILHGYAVSVVRPEVDGCSVLTIVEREEVRDDRKA